MNPTEFRFRVLYAKTEAMRYTGHLDMQRAWERLLRRARLPLSYSCGFHPHPQIQLGAALPLGITGQAELAEFWLTEERETEEVQHALGAAVPPGICVCEVQRLEHSARHVDREIAAGEYVVDLPAGGWPADIPARIAELLARDTVLRERRGKSYDLRPLILEMDLASDRLRMVLTLAPGATGRPDEVMAELGLGEEPILVSRDKLLLAENNAPHTIRDAK